MAAALVVAAGAFAGAYSWLAPTQLLPTDILVVEGWCEDEVLESALAEFDRGQYAQLLVTGGPLDKGSYLSHYRTFAELGAATLTKLGRPGIPIVAVPAPKTDRDRTYASALALRRWLHRSGSPPPRLNLMTVGTHARRSRLLFQKALGEETQVGILAAPDPSFDSRRWWASSSGFRGVIAEWIAYLYAATLFHPSPEPDAVVNRPEPRPHRDTPESLPPPLPSSRDLPGGK